MQTQQTTSLCLCLLLTTVWCGQKKGAWVVTHEKLNALRTIGYSQKLSAFHIANSNRVIWYCSLTFPGAKAVRFVEPNQKGRGPDADVDMIAMSLADYFILANSTFCW